MQLTLSKQVQKIIDRADDHGVAAINDSDFDNCLEVVSELISSAAERDCGDLILAVGPHSTIDITDGWPEKGARIHKEYNPGDMIYMFVSFSGDSDFFVKNEMASLETVFKWHRAGKRSWITRRINDLKREYSKTKTAGKKSGITKRIKKLEKLR